MKQQLSGTKGIVIGDISVRIGADMDIQQEGLSIADDSIGIPEIGLALADGFDLGAAQGNSSFELFQQKIVVTGGAIDGSITRPSGDRVSRLGFLRNVLGGMAGLAWHTVRASMLARKGGASQARHNTRGCNAIIAQQRQ